MSVETIIKLENVVKVFNNLEVIHNCNMNVPKGGQIIFYALFLKELIYGGFEIIKAAVSFYPLKK